jgi:hypothetical protein
MDEFSLPPPEIASRATMEKGFISFFDRKGRCMGRRDIDYVDILDSCFNKSFNLSVQTLYLKLIWRPLNKIQKYD